MHSAAWNGHLEVVKVLIESGADANIANNVRYRIVDWYRKSCLYQDAQTALHLAVQNSHILVVEALIVSGADVNIADQVCDYNYSCS